jgi:hypothetical protein
MCHAAFNRRRRLGDAVAGGRVKRWITVAWVCPELLTAPADDGYPLQIRLVKPQAIAGHACSRPAGGGHESVDASTAPSASSSIATSWSRS